MAFTGETRKEYTTWHKVEVYGGFQKFAATIEKGDLVAVSGPIYAQSFAGKNGKVQFYAMRATALEMLKRKNSSNPDAALQAPTEAEECVPK